MKLGIVLYPSKAYQDYINNYRKRYDSHYGVIAPHITLKDAFKYQRMRSKLLQKKLLTSQSQVHRLR